MRNLKEFLNEELVTEGYSKVAIEWRDGAKSIEHSGIKLVRKSSGAHDIKSGGKVIGGFQLEDDEWLVTIDGKQKMVGDDLEDVIKHAKSAE